MRQFSRLSGWQGRPQLPTAPFQALILHFCLPIVLMPSWKPSKHVIFLLSVPCLARRECPEYSLTFMNEWSSVYLSFKIMFRANGNLIIYSLGKDSNFPLRWRMGYKGTNIYNCLSLKESSLRSGEGLTLGGIKLTNILPGTVLETKASFILELSWINLWGVLIVWVLFRFLSSPRGRAVAWSQRRCFACRRSPVQSQASPV